MERKKSTNGGLEAKREGPMRPDSLAAWDPLSWASRLRCRRSFLQNLCLDLKPTIKIVPDALRRGGGRKHRNRDLELQIGGGKLRQSAAGVVSISPNDISTVSMMKRE